MFLIKSKNSKYHIAEYLWLCESMSYSSGIKISLKEYKKLKPLLKHQRFKDNKTGIYYDIRPKFIYGYCYIYEDYESVKEVPDDYDWNSINNLCPYCRNKILGLSLDYKSLRKK